MRARQQVYILMKPLEKTRLDILSAGFHRGVGLNADSESTWACLLHLVTSPSSQNEACSKRICLLLGNAWKTRDHHALGNFRKYPIGDFAETEIRSLLTKNEAKFSWSDIEIKISTL